MIRNGKTNLKSNFYLILSISWKNIYLNKLARKKTENNIIY